jgi:hypothetical protein
MKYGTEYIDYVTEHKHNYLKDACIRKHLNGPKFDVSITQHDYSDPFHRSDRTTRTTPVQKQQRQNLDSNTDGHVV